ncbi:hypothetical protein HRbin01_01918 [archaeon HR01]|nr:hypothetical protein HRbin01_01918 [archaeon HR01]
MSRLMALTISTKPGDVCWLSRLSRLDGRLFAKVIEQQSVDGGWRIQFFRISADNKAGEVESFLKKEKSFRELRTVMSSDGLIYGTAVVKCSRACGIEEAGSCILRGVSTGAGGEVVWSLIGPGTALRRFMQRLSERGIMYETVELSVVKPNGGLTSRQEMIIKAALELGFFDYPKKIHVKELAQLFGITPATFTETLRKALKRIVKEHVTLAGSLEKHDEISRTS